MPADIPFKACTAYIVCTSTQGKEIITVYIQRINKTKGVVTLWSNSGQPNGGWSHLKGCFFTKAQARNDWRRRNDSETKEHIAIIKAAGQSLIDKANAIKVREKDDWRNL